MVVLGNVPPESYAALDDKIKALTGEPSLCEDCYVVGVVGHVRGSSLQLDEAVQKVVKFSNDHRGEKGIHDVRQIEVYADRLTAPAPVRLPPTCDAMTLIARDAFSQPGPVKLQLSGGSGKQLLVALYCELAPSPIQLAVEFPGKMAHVTINPAAAGPAHRYWGVTAQADGTGSVESFDDTHTIRELFDNSTRSIVDMINDDGRLAAMGWDKYNSNLRRLLNYQLLLASRHQHQDAELAYQLADFVVKLCRGIPKAFDLFSQAGMISTAKAVGHNALITSLVPKLDLSIAQQVLSSRLGAAAAFDSAYRELRGQAADSKNARLFANVALEKSVDSDQVYAFMARTAGERLAGARQAFDKANREFQALQLELKEKQDAFKAGIDAWKTSQAWKVVGEVFTAVAAVVGGIALACAAPPAGAGAIGAGAAELGSAIEGAKEAVGLWEEIKDVAKAIEKVYKKIEPYLKKVQELMKAIAAIVDLVKKMKSMDDVKNEDIEKLKVPAIEGDDALNMTADWDVFQVELSKLYDGIKGEGIGGAGDFFLLIAKMVIRGKAVFAAQTAFKTAGDAYLTVVQQRLAQQKHTDRLRKAIPQIQGDDRVFDVIKLAMAERLLGLRTWIHLDFRQYLAAYAWNTLDAEHPIALDPMKDVASFLTDAATLQALSSQVSAYVRAQERTFYFSSSSSSSSSSLSSRELDGVGALVQPDGFLESLKASRTASFTLDCESRVFQNYGRVRVSRARVFLQGGAGALPGGDGAVVSIRVTLGAAMKDLGLERAEEEPLLSIPRSAASARVLSFSTTESTFGFEYTGGRDRVILMDGTLRESYRSSSSLLLSPFRTWTLEVGSGVDLSSVSGMSLELTCEATYL